MTNTILLTKNELLEELRTDRNLFEEHYPEGNFGAWEREYNKVKESDFTHFLVTPQLEIAQTYKKLNHPDELPATDLARVISKLRKSGQSWNDIDNFKNTTLPNTIDGLNSIGYELVIVESVGVVGVREKEVV